MNNNPTRSRDILNADGIVVAEGAKPEIIPSEAETVRMIFKWFLDGMSLNGIAQKLSEMKIKTKSGKKKWHKFSVKKILVNEKYTGDVLLQKTYTVDCISHKTVKNNGERPKYLVTDALKAIIDRDTFNLVQHMITD